MAVAAKEARPLCAEAALETAAGSPVREARPDETWERIEDL